LIGLDVDQRDREHVALLGALDEHRSGEGVDQVEVERGDVVRGRVVSSASRVSNTMWSPGLARATGGIAGW
jgi:hypothetical protein